MSNARTYKHIGSWIDGDKLHDLGTYIYHKRGNKTACLDGDFTADKLEEVVIFMKNAASSKGDST